MTVVVIDPGHGGTEKVGGSSPNNAKGPTGLLEKNVTLDIALRTKALLELQGVETSLTRETDVNLGLADRAQIAARARAHAYVSIHLNGWDGRVQGTETYVHSRSSKKSSTLAESVQAAVLAATRHNNRGVKRADFATINPRHHHSDTAACLVEISFMDTPDEERRLRDPRYLEAIASALKDGIVNALARRSIVSRSALNAPDEPQDGYEVFLR